MRPKLSHLVIVTVAVGLLAAGTPRAAAPAVPPRMQVILLGTGYPRPDPNRAGPSTAVAVGGRLFVVDAGRGVMMRLAATEFAPKTIDTVLLTHLHSDHTAGLPDLFTSTWVRGRAVPLQLYGPEGTAEMAQALLQFFAADIHIRRDLTEKNAPAGATIRTHIVHEGTVYQDQNVTITAFREDHRPVEPAFGYRFESHGRIAVISGDTRPNDNLVRAATGADVLVLEACLPEYFDRVDTPEAAANLKRYHTSAEEAGQVAQKAGVKLLVLTHLIPGDADGAFIERAGKYFHGSIVAGRDLMRF